MGARAGAVDAPQPAVHGARTCHVDTPIVHGHCVSLYYTHSWDRAVPLPDILAYILLTRFLDKGINM